VRPLVFLALAGCSLTPIPDVSSNYSVPCVTSERVCAVPFKLIASGQKSVELRGDFAPGAWTSGVTMTKANGYWTATVAVPWGAAVQYKFFVDGMTWETDPENPKTVVNGGNTNSLIEDVQCVMWTCTQ
jgi:1,4-alpha-glucan branching enzyme